VARSREAPAEGRLTNRALNRALLARQHLLARRPGPVEDVVESIGAVQAQHWPAVPVALWSRTGDLADRDLPAALEDRRLVVGSLVRGTLHVVAARQHPGFAAAVEASEAVAWQHTPEAAPGADDLRAALLDHARDRPRSAEQLVAFIEAWVAEHPGAFGEAELALQRRYRWRRFRSWPGLVRAPADGRWAGRAPSGHVAAPGPPSAWPAPADALDAVVRRHLAAFGPAAAEDVAGWIGWRTPPVREALARLGGELVAFRDEAGRLLHDLAGAPRPDPAVEAPVRLLPWFDSALLAYAPDHRGRILPAAYRDRVYLRANLQWLPTILVDGLVAGTWSMAAARREATLTLRPFEAPARRVRAAIAEEAERLLRFRHPAAASHRVTFET
jgi:hypothetical protein